MAANLPEKSFGKSPLGHFALERPHKNQPSFFSYCFEIKNKLDNLTPPKREGGLFWVKKVQILQSFRIIHCRRCKFI